LTGNRVVTALSLGAVSLILGVLLTFQLRATSVVAGLPYDQTEQLTLEFNNLTKQNAGLEALAANLQKQVDEAQAGKYGALRAAEAELKGDDLAAGFTAVTGPGVKITLNNVTAGTSADTSVYVIRDEDLLKLVNELDAAGAEAVSINGQRIIATSEIRLAGSNIDVNLQPIAPPFVVLAIGNSDRLAQNLAMAGGVLSFLQDLGISVSVEEESRVVVPGYQGRPDLSHAQPVVRPGG